MHEVLYMLCVIDCGFLFLSALIKVADGAFFSGSERSHILLLVFTM